MKISIRSENVAVGIQLIDCNFDTIARGQGILEATVDPGLYRVKYELGAECHTDDIEVEPDGPDPLVLEAPRLLLSSAAPLPDTDTTHEYQRYPARDLSRETHVDLGGDASIFVFAREQSEDKAWDKPGKGITLHRLDGTVVADLATGSVSEPNRYAGLTVKVPEGAYLLRCDDGPIEMAVVACEDWQTQVFLSRKEFQNDEGETVRCLDLGDAAILMAPQGIGFDFDDVGQNREMETAEGARAALKTGNRVSISSVQMNALLSGKFVNPMLGIYGGHLLLMGVADTLQRARKAFDSPNSPFKFSEAAQGLLALLSSPNGRTEYVDWVNGLSSQPDFTGLVPDLLGIVDSWDVGREVVNRLSQDDLAGKHPDVRALLTALGQNVGSFETPPMLKASWNLLVEASSSQPDLVPTQSLAGQAATALIGGGSWLTWDPKELSEVRTRSLPTADLDFETFERSILDADLVDFARPMLSTIEKSALSIATGYVASSAQLEMLNTRSPSESSEGDGFMKLLSLLPSDKSSSETVVEWVSKSMQMPVNVAAETLSKISAKLNE